MRRTFRLATVERLRAGGLEQATRDLGAARTVLAKAQRAVADKQAEILACVPDLRSGPTSVTALGHRRELLRDQAEQLTVEAEAARVQLATCLTAWRQARSRLEAVAALHERHRVALAEHDVRQEQRITDELAVVSTFARRRSPHRPGAGPFDPSGGDAA
jgi:flagellar export protein FliJ